MSTPEIVTTPVEDFLAHCDLAKRLRQAHVRRRRLPVPRRAGRAPGPEQVAISDQPDA